MARLHCLEEKGERGQDQWDRTEGELKCNEWLNTGSAEQMEDIFQKITVAERGAHSCK